MKKYMKPIMESENFVTNEFIGACFIATCNTKGCDVGGEIYGFEGKVGINSYTAEYDAMAKFATSLNGSLADIEGNQFTVFTVDDCCQCTEYDTSGGIDTFQDFLYLLYQGFVHDNWGWRPTVKGDNHHHFTLTTGHVGHPNASV